MPDPIDKLLKRKEYYDSQTQTQAVQPKAETPGYGIFSLENAKAWGNYIINDLRQGAEKFGITDAADKILEGTKDLNTNPIEGGAKIGTGLLGFISSPFMAADKTLRDAGAGVVADAVAYPFNCW